MYYPHPDDSSSLEFSGDMNNFVSAHKYRVFSPDDELLHLIINSLVPTQNQFTIWQSPSHGMPSSITGQASTRGEGQCIYPGFHGH